MVAVSGIEGATSKPPDGAEVNKSLGPGESSHREDRQPQTQGYDQRATPFERLKACPQADREQIARLEKGFAAPDPFELESTPGEGWFGAQTLADSRAALTSNLR
jgi:hypothetical protein